MFSELGHVVNYDVPHMPEDYIHRVGRTGRAEQTGMLLPHRFLNGQTSI